MDVYDVKGIIESAFKALDAPVVFDQNAATVPWLHDGIQAAVKLDNRVIGHFGELHPLVLKNYKLDGPVFVAEIELGHLLTRKTHLLRMKQLPRFHFSQRDLSITVKDSINYSDIAAVIEANRPENLESWQIFDVYKGKQIQAGYQSIALTFKYRHPQAHDAEQGRPLTDDEVTQAHAKIVDAINEKLGGILR